MPAEYGWSMHQQKRMLLLWTRTLTTVVVFGISGTSFSSDPDAKALPPVHGRWIFGFDGKPVLPRKFERGLQTSGLVFRDGRLWSVGDQRSQFPGHIFLLGLKHDRLVAPPVRTALAKDSELSPNAKEYSTVRNPDLEGLAIHPLRRNAFLSVTEDKQSWIVEIVVTEPLSSPSQATITRLTKLAFPDGTTPHQNDLNYRAEGITISRSTNRVYLAYERLKDGLPRIFTLPLSEAVSGAVARPREVAFDFSTISRRKGKPNALLNLNGLDVVTVGGRDKIVAVARDQERLFVLDPEEKTIDQIIDLDLRSPLGEKILWVSPEGVGIDAKSGRLWIVNDPDSIRGRYRLAKNKKASGNFAAFAPLVFELRLEDVVKP